MRADEHTRKFVGPAALQAAFKRIYQLFVTHGQASYGIIWPGDGVAPSVIVADSRSGAKEPHSRGQAAARQALHDVSPEPWRRSDFAGMSASGAAAFAAGCKASPKISYAEAERRVASWRALNPAIVYFWNDK